MEMKNRMENPSAVPLNSEWKVREEAHGNLSVGKRLRRYFRDYCEGSSLIGFRYLGEKRSRGERILWFFIILLSIVLSIYYVVEIYSKYVENPFIVNMATRESPIFKIPFPAVTICPTVKTSKNYFNFTGAIHRLLDDENITDEDMRYTQYFSLVCDSIDESYKEKLPPNKTFTEDFFDSLDYLKPSFSEVFSICQFMGHDVECEDLFVPVVVDEGICYTFNMLNREDIYKDNVYYYSDYLQNLNHTNWTINEGYPKGTGQNVYPRRALLSGADNALEIYLLQRTQETDYLCLQDTEGYTVHLHTPQTIPQLKKNYFSVPLDTSVRAIVKPGMMTTSKEVKNYKTMDRKCYFTDERFLKYFEIYTPENCQLECLTNHTLEMCNCVNYFMPRQNTTDICGNAMSDCMKLAEISMKTREIESQLSEDYQTSNGCNCMPICTSLSYQAETSRTPFPWRDIFRAEKTMVELLGPLELDKKMHLSKLSIYFSSDMFLQMERTELYGFFDLMSNIGGILGLFNGFALLSVVEIIYYISVRLWCNYQLHNDILES
ncbi:unnamed protein product [Phaedon cochleariae]|uniref:Uncharacterized protein n=1 Tax=Phaedon cochleariae TaxID=80249 RepID=A0A9P0DQ02_PHACE|nr:unnamed protein product [Phaedon cochleariae]